MFGTRNINISTNLLQISNNLMPLFNSVYTVCVTSPKGEGFNITCFVLKICKMSNDMKDKLNI